MSNNLRMIKFSRFYDLQSMRNILFIKFALRREISIQMSLNFPASPQLGTVCNQMYEKTLTVALLLMQYRSNLIRELSYLGNSCLL